MYERFKLFVLKNLWSKDVFHGRGGNFYIQLIKNLALYVWVNGYQRLS